MSMHDTNVSSTRECLLCNVRENNCYSSNQLEFLWQFIRMPLVMCIFKWHSKGYIWIKCTFRCSLKKIIAKPLNLLLQTIKNIEHHKKTGSTMPWSSLESMSWIRCKDRMINYLQGFCNYPAHIAAGTNGNLVCPKAWSAYLLPAAVWQQGHQSEAAFSPSPRLRANAVLLNPSQAAATVHSKPRQEGGEKIREQGGMIFMVEVPWVMWFISHTAPLLPFVNKAVMQPV